MTSTALLLSSDAASIGETSTATSREPRWTLSSCAAVGMLRMTTVLKRGFGPQYFGFATIVIDWPGMYSFIMYGPLPTEFWVTQSSAVSAVEAFAAAVPP